MGFEPTRAEHNGLAVHRLNHSATSSEYTNINVYAQFCNHKERMKYIQFPYFFLKDT